jgi:hypothetical protein
VPCPPELTALLHEHIDRFGTAADGRLFVGQRNHKEMPKARSIARGGKHAEPRSRQRWPRRYSPGRRMTCATLPFRRG